MATMASFAIIVMIDNSTKDVAEKFVRNLKFRISTTGVDVGTLSHARIEYIYAILFLENVSLLHN